MRRLLLPLLLALALPASAVATTLRFDGIGPLDLGMTTADAEATGWIAHKAKGCELERPAPAVYRLDGAKAPDGLRGSAEFAAGKLRGVTVTRGAHTAAGVTPGVTTFKGMARLYRARGYKVRIGYDATFAGTFVDVLKKGEPLISAFGGGTSGRRIAVLGIPFVPVCE